MVKTRLLAGVVAVMSVGAMVAIPSTSNAQVVDAENDSRIIVEVSKSIEGLTTEDILASQNIVFNRIKNSVAPNIEIVTNYSVLNNAFLAEVNSDAVDLIKSVPGVKSVTIDKLHEKKATSSPYTARFSKSDTVEKNISAETMHKPSNTNDGEGTAVAILDNEFFFRGEHKNSAGDCVDGIDCSFHNLKNDDGSDATCHGDAVGHVVYTELDDDVKVKYTFDQIKSKNYPHAKHNKKLEAGVEGSLYYNSKVPFYYDYGGLTTVYGKTGTPDNDVSSILDYHGSHVASITAANDPLYKGIAPKAQLVCMKVFTEYKADETGKNLGFSNYSGAYDSCILNALEDCISLGVDGINMSLGSDLDDFDQDSITLKTLTRLASEEGILTSISAGNSGKSSYSSLGGYANWTSEMVETGILSSYANNSSVMTIAAGEPTEIYYDRAIQITDTDKGKTFNIAYEDQIVNREGEAEEYSKEYLFEDLGNKEFVYIPGFGTDSDYKDRDVTGKVAVVNRGSTAFSDKYNIAKNKGAVGIVIINNDPTASEFNFRCSFGDDFNPSMPCALALFKNKQDFIDVGSGPYTLITEKALPNPENEVGTVTSFSSDGATFDLDLKPDINSPGDLIRGAVPPQTAVEKGKEVDKKSGVFEGSWLHTYHYLSGTSMSAPNYAGAQSVVLSKMAKDVYADGKATNEELKALKEYRSTVDMRLMSTADPKLDSQNNPEQGKRVFTSPRMQGAGMVDLDGAYNTNVYLEGLNAEGKGINRSKIVLRNNEQISKGVVDLSFLAHNESQETYNYDVKLTVMRPAIKQDNTIVTSDYNFRGEIDSIKSLPGITYYDGYDVVKSIGSASYKDVYKITKELKYYTNREDYEAQTNPVIIAQGTYYCSSNVKDSSTNLVWEPLPSHDYQSVQDYVIAEVTGQTVSIAPGESKIHIDNFTLPKEAKDKILSFYKYGCYIEGYVELTSKDSQPDLSIPYLGYYSGTDRNPEQTLDSAPVVEPFSFEKKAGEVYPSDLVNDITKSLLGKDKVNFESMIVIGHTNKPSDVNVNKILTNDEALDSLVGFHKIGTNPSTEQYLDDVENNLYVGNPYQSNTMLIQQFVLRSVVDNNFTLKNKETGEIVYKSALEDMLFGEQRGKYSLYKSHVDPSYLGAGYVAHRAYAAVPLYNPDTKVPFKDGKYELTFNYTLSSTGHVVSKSYNLFIDSTAPNLTSIKQIDADGAKSKVRIEFKDMNVSYAIIGYYKYDVKYDSEKDVYYVELEKAEVNKIMSQIGATKAGQKRLYVKAVDMAWGEMASIIHFNDANNYSNYEIAQSRLFTPTNDFIKDGGNIVYVEVSKAGATSPIEIPSEDVVFRGGDYSEPALSPQQLGVVIGASVGGAIIIGSVVTMIILKKKRII